MIKTIKILQTSDVHGYIYPYAYADHKPAYNGLARISQAIQNLRDDYTIVIDSGDTIQGSAFTYYHALGDQSTPSPMAMLLNAVGYDYYTVGNHDFNYGQKYLDTFTTFLDAKVLSNNIFKDENLVFFPYDIKDIEGIKIGIIGTTTQHIPHWENRENIKGITFEHVLEATKRTIAKIREDVDAIVVSYHGGFEADLESGQALKNETGENCGYQLIVDNPEIDVLLTGHQHRILSGQIKNCVYTQPGFNGSHLGIVELTFEAFDNKWQLVSKSSTLKEMITEADPAIERLGQAIEDKVQVWLDKELGHLENGDLLITDPLMDRFNKHPLVQFINDVQMDASDAKISLTALGNTIKGFSKVITLRDVISTYVYPNTLVVLSMTGSVLKEALEKSAEFFVLENEKVAINKHYLEPKLELYNYDMYDGIDYTIDLNKPFGSRITHLCFEGQAIDPKSNYEVVMNNYRSSGGGNFTMFENARIVKTIEMDIVDLIVNYIMHHKSIHIDYKNNINIKVK